MPAQAAVKPHLANERDAFWMPFTPMRSFTQAPMLFDRAQGMHYPNRMHYDDDFALDGRYGRLVAPQSFPVATDDGHGAAPAETSRVAESP